MRCNKRILALTLAFLMLLNMLQPMALATGETDPAPQQSQSAEPLTTVQVNTIASGECGENLTWTLDENGLLTISGTGAMTDYSWSWQSYREQITMCVIENGVTNIGSGAFCNCSSLTDITIPASVTNIGSEAFCNCSSLTSITVAEGNPVYHSAGNCLIETKSKTLIAGCQSSVIPTDGSVTSIGDSAFSNCSSLTDITIPASVTSIGSSAFFWCSSLNSVTIPDSVTSIGDSAFSSCSSLTSVTIPDSVTSIGHGAFYYCSSVTSITIPDSVTSIGDSVFSYCSNLTSIAVAEGNPVYHSDGNCLIETASKTLLVGCQNSVIPTDGSVTSVGGGAFKGCSSLTDITIPASVTSIGKWAFSGCSNLTSITVAEGNRVYRSNGNCLIETAFKTLLVGCQNSVIPTDGSVTRIESNAFSWCSNLTSITIPDSVTRIESNAFYLCSNLTSITFEGDAPTIASSPFYNVTATVYYPANNTTWTEAVRQNYGGNLTWVAQGIETPEPPAEVVYGDIDGNEVVNSRDSVSLMQYLASWEVNIDDVAADVNGDGVINSRDTVLLMQYLAGWEVTLG